MRNNTSDTLTTLASGTVPAPGTGTWQHLALTFNGHTISAAINGTTVGTVTDPSYASGMVGFGTSGYQTDQFDNLSVTLVGSATPSGPIVAGDDTADCADANGGSGANGTKVQMWPCNGKAPARRPGPWSNGTVQINGACLDITGATQQRHADRGMGLQRRGQPAVAGGERRAGEPGLRQVPRRPGVQHRRAPSSTCGPATAAATSSGRCPEPLAIDSRAPG